MKKRVISLILAVLMLTALTACGGDADRIAQLEAENASLKAQVANPGSKLASANRPDLDNLTAPFPHTSWRSQIEHAKKIGLGEDTYELVNIG